MSVRVLSVSRMPHNVKVWVDDRDDGKFIVYIDEALVSSDGAQALEQILNSTIVGWRRLDDTMVRRALRAVTG